MLTLKSNFDAKNSDIKIQSSDGVVFDLHSILLAENTVEEPAKVLSVCFGFVYPKKHPDLDEIKDFELVAAIAAAVEKYSIYSAMYSCDIRLRSFIAQRPIEILVHSIDNGYPKLMEIASSYLSRNPLVPTLEKLPPDYIIPWVRYHEAWVGAFRETMKHIEAVPSSPTTNQCHTTLFIKLDHHVICANCRSSMLLWVTSLEKIDNFSDLSFAIEGISTSGLQGDNNPRGVPCCNNLNPPPFAQSRSAGVILPSKSQIAQCPSHYHECRCIHAKNVGKFLRGRIQAIPPLDTFITSRRPKSVKMMNQLL